MRKKIISSLILWVMLISTFLPWCNKVQAADKTYTLDELRRMYPTGMQWNDSYNAARECLGFAGLMYSKIYGINPFTYAEAVYDVEQIEPGDMVRYNGHSVLVLSRDGENTTVVECNYDWNNHVRWDHPKSMSEFRNNFVSILKGPYVLGTSPKPGTPKNASVDTSAGVKVSWERTYNCYGYKLIVYDEQNNKVSETIAKKASTTSANIFNLLTGTYTVRVYAIGINDTLSSGYTSAKFSCKQEATSCSDPAENIVLGVGDSYKYSFRLTPSNGIAKTEFFFVSSTDESVISLDGNTVTGLKEGSTELYFQFKTSKTTRNVPLKVLVVAPIKLAKSTVQIEKGSTYKLGVTPNPKGGTPSWFSSDKNIVKVDSEGNITALSPGVATIRVSQLIYNSDQSAYTYLDDECEVVVPGPPVEATKISLDKTSISIRGVRSEKLTATVSPANTTNKTVNWSSSNTNVATVDSTGRVRGVSKGSVVITAATSNGKTAKCNVNVQNEDEGETPLFSGRVDSKTYTSGDFVYSILDDGTIVLMQYLGTAKNLVIPDKIDGRTVTKIYSTCFLDNSYIVNVTLPKNILYLDMYAFRNCPNLVSVNIPDGILYISRMAFYICPKLTYTVPKSLTKLENDDYAKISEITIDGTNNYDLAREVFELTNKERVANGLKPLEYCQELVDVAMKRAGETSAYWSHSRLTGGDCFTIASNFDGENIGYTSPTMSTAKIVVEDWMNSAMHRRAILDSSYNSIGIGVYRVNGHTFWVQTFSTNSAKKNVSYSGTKDLTQKVKIANGYGYLENIRVYGFEENNVIDIGEKISPTKVCIGNKLKTLGIYNREIYASDLSWRSTNEKVFTVDKNGTVTGVGAGSAKLIATIGNYSIECNITVEDMIPEGTTMNLDKSLYQLNSLNETVTLKAMLSIGRETTAKWSSSNPEIAKVDANGKVTAVSGGFAYITAQSDYGADKCWIYVCMLRTMSDGRKVYPGDLDGNGVINSNDAALISELYNSNITTDETAAGDVNGDGVVNSNDVTEVLDKTVELDYFKLGEYTPITSITINKTAITLEKGDTAQLSATYSPTNTTDSPKLRWYSSNKAVATVDSNGKITAIGGGTATITASSSSGTKAICAVKVNEPVKPSPSPSTSPTPTTTPSPSVSPTITPSPTPTPTPTPDPTPTFKLGDVNADGKVNARDAKLVLQYFNGKATLTAEQRARADINKDKKINARDAKLILQIFNGKQI